MNKKIAALDHELGVDENFHFPAWGAIFDDFFVQATVTYEKIFNGNFLSRNSENSNRNLPKKSNFGQNFFLHQKLFQFKVWRSAFLGQFQ